MQHDVRQLIARARESFHSMYLEWEAEYDLALLDKVSGAGDAAAMAARTRSVAIITPPGATLRPAGEQPRFRHLWRAWWRRPSKWRDDVVWANGSFAVSIVDDDSSTTYVSAQRTAYRSRPADSPWARLQAALGVRPAPRPATVQDRLPQVPLVDPSFLLDGWQLGASGESRHLGRDTVRVRASRLGPDARTSLWESVSRYDVDVDVERGVLLRLAPVVEGVEAAVFSVTVARFDEPVPDEIFSWQPPSGTRTIFTGR